MGYLFSEITIMYTKGEPHAVEISAGDTQYICQCGKTSNPPFCDGSHAGSEFEPLAYTAKTDETVYVCGCGKTDNKPFCDGSHNS